MSDQKHNARNPNQEQQFIEAARALECDESEERFDETLKKVARHKPRDDEALSTDLSKELKELK